MNKSKLVSTKRERRSSKTNISSKQPLHTQSFVTLGALVTGLANMSDELNQTETLIINHSPSRTFPVKLDEQVNLCETLDESISSRPPIDESVDSGLMMELEKTNVEEELSCTTSTHPGVIIPEEKRVTDRVKVFEAVANHDQSILKKDLTKNGHQKKSSSCINEQKQVSPSSLDSFDTQSFNDLKSSTGKSKSKRTSLKKQLQNLLKIDKSSTQDDLPSVDEQTNGKKSTNFKRDISSTNNGHEILKKPLEIRIESIGSSTADNGLLTSETPCPTVSELIHNFQSNSSNELEPTVVVQSTEPQTSSPSTLVSQSDLSENFSSNSPVRSAPVILAHSPMSSGVGESVRTSTRSVSMESHSRHRSPGQYREPGTSSSFAHSSNAQVTDNLRVQHQREKQELSDLNDRFRGYLDRVKILEHKNSHLTNQLDDVSKTWGSASQIIISQYGTPLDRLRQEVNESMMDEADLQTRLRRSHLTIDNYRSLIHDESVWNDRQEEKREQLKLEYERSCVELASLQTSYKQVEDQLKYLSKQREDHLQEIDQLNEQFYVTTIDRIKSDLQVQTLREEIPFLNDIYSHLISEYEQLKPTNGMDTQLFYRQELEKAIRDIRRDFEMLHGAQRKEMEDYYNIKIEDMQNDAKKSLPLHSRQDDLMKTSEQIKLTKFEINDTQKLLIQEKNQFRDLQDRLAKLEEEYNYIRDQRSHVNDATHRDLNNSHERIQQLTEEIDTILRSNITLESEINIYRRLLDSETKRLTQQPVEHILPVEPAPPSFGSELGKVFNKKIKKGPVAIKDCAPDGKCITLENSSTDKDVDVSNWLLKRRVEGSPEIAYTIPYGLVIKHGNELKIFARTAQNAHHRPPSQVVNDKLDSWGMGTECETKLFNEQGEEKASHSQKIVFGSESSHNLP